MVNSEYLKQTVEPLLDWFRENARDLPWRETADLRKKTDMTGSGSPERSYYVWISEIMLQQTRVEAVKLYFLRFIQALPDISALAVCPEDKLLKLWEGLGYYNRVRNMQKAAVRVLEEYDGRLPADYEALLDLPGIGSYTAGAIASIAYNIPAPAVDGNVLRVISRIVENEEDITKQSVRTGIEAAIKEIIPKACPGIFNQALMELGAIVCLPNGMPECDRCPVSDLCLARLHGKIEEIPKKKVKQQRRIEERTVLVIRDGFYTVIRKRPKMGLLAGLYELPNMEGHRSEDEVLCYLKEEGLAPIRIQSLPPAKHIFSHVEWRMSGYMVLVEQMSVSDNPDLMIVEPKRTEAEYPIPAAFAAYVQYLQILLGQEKYEQEKKQ